MREILRDPLRLDHMHDAICRILDFDKSNALDRINESDIEYYGIVKLLEIIGEAAYKLTIEFKNSHPETPWKYIIGMRHVLVHGYYQVNRQDIIKTIRNDLPVLLSQIKLYLLEFPSGESHSLR